jgi:hypothetical protein
VFVVIHHTWPRRHLLSPAGRGWQSKSVTRAICQVSGGGGTGVLDLGWPSWLLGRRRRRGRGHCSPDPERPPNPTNPAGAPATSPVAGAHPPFPSRGVLSTLFRLTQDGLTSMQDQGSTFRSGAANTVPDLIPLLLIGSTPGKLMHSRLARAVRWRKVWQGTTCGHQPRDERVQVVRRRYPAGGRGLLDTGACRRRHSPLEHHRLCARGWQALI